MEYPPTRHTDIVDRRFGIEVPDPYRWLEGDAREDPEVADWILAQDAAARSYLASLPSRRNFQRRLTELFDHVRLTAPRKRGRTYFFTRQSGSDEQPVLLAREGDSGPERVLIDPNGWAGDRATALAEWSGAVTPIMLANERYPGGLPMSVFDGFRKALSRNRAQFFLDVPTGPFYGFNRDGAEISEGLIRNWWRQGMSGGAKAHYDCVEAFSETDFTDDLRAVSVPVLIMHGEDDQVVPIDASAREAIKLLSNGVLKTYPGLSHRLFATHPDIINADLLAFIEQRERA